MGKPIENKPSYSFEEYQALEQSSQERFEFFHGEIFAMSGATKNHNTMVLNCASLFRNHFKGKGCKVFAEGVQLEKEHRGVYFYPDVMVTCDERDFEEGLKVKFPKIIVEVLSKSTAFQDLNRKYYLIVSQSDYTVKIYERKGEGWSFSVVQGIESSINLAQIGLALPLKEIYDDIKLEP